MKNKMKNRNYVLVLLAFMFSISFVSAACDDRFSAPDNYCCNEYIDGTCRPYSDRDRCSNDGGCVDCGDIIYDTIDPGFNNSHPWTNYCVYGVYETNSCFCGGDSICKCVENRDDSPGQYCSPYNNCTDPCGTTCPTCQLDISSSRCDFGCDEGYLDCDGYTNGCEERCYSGTNCTVLDDYTCVYEDGEWKWIEKYNGDYCEEPEEEEPEEPEEPEEEEPEEPEEASPRGKLERLYISRILVDGVEKKITISQVRKLASPKDDIRLDARLYNINTQMDETSVFNTWNVIDYSSAEGEQHLLLNMTGTDLMEKTWQFFSSIRLK